MSLNLNVCTVLSFNAISHSTFNNFLLIFFKTHSDMHKDLCRGGSGLCDAMRPTKGADLLKYLRKVNFTGEYKTSSSSEPFPESKSGKCMSIFKFDERVKSILSSHKWIRCTYFYRSYTVDRYLYRYFKSSVRREKNVISTIKHAHK